MRIEMVPDELSDTQSFPAVHISTKEVKPLSSFHSTSFKSFACMFAMFYNKTGII